MSNLNVQLTGGSLQIVDNINSLLRTNSPIGAIISALTAADYHAYFQVGLTSTTLTFPANLPVAGTIFWLWVKNLGTALQAVTVTMSPAAGGSAGYVLANGGALLYAQPGTSLGGITAVTLISTVQVCPCEILLGG